MEIDQLFETLTIKELKQQNIKTRTEIECKKEELRFLVSERYRDIIDAADTIFDMKSCSNEISESLKVTNNICKKWNSVMVGRYVDINNETDKYSCELQIRYSVAAQIKLLLNMSELIWNALENTQFSEAAMLFNICRNMAIHSQLSCDKYRNGDFDMQTIFSRQWSSLQNLEETIGIISRKYLKSCDKKQNIENTLDCLVSIVILEDKSLEEVLKEYMECVESQIQEWFSVKASTVQINVQLCSVASIITRTISNVHELFMDDQVLKRVKELANTMVQNMSCVRGERIYLYLPEQISRFKPASKSFQNNSSGVATDKIICLTDEWLNRYRQKYQTEFISSFSHLTTIKSVGETRHELKKIFIENEGNLTEDNKWKKLELNNAMDWNCIIGEIYSKKLQMIIEQCMSVSFENWSNGIEKFIATNESLMSEDEFNEDFFFNYLWTECSKDVFFNSENISSPKSSDVNQSENRIIFDALYNHFSNHFDMGPSTSNKNCNFEALVIKSKVIRPEIYQIVKVFNDCLLQLIIEIIETVDDCEEFLLKLLYQCLTSIVDKCLSWINHMSTADEAMSPSSKDKLKKDKEFPHVKTESENFINSYQFRMIILYQSIRSLYETFPALQAGLMTSAVSGDLSKALSSNEKSLLKSKKSKHLRLPYLPGKKLQHQSDYECLMWNTWNESIEQLKNSVDMFVLRGIRPSIHNLVALYFNNIKSAFASVDVCEYLATKWTEMSLAQTESESNIPISLEIPNQCSWLMHRLLINTSRLLTIFGGHSISRKNLNEIRLEILKSVILQYEILMKSDEIKENKSCQKQNIQLIFDLRFLLEIINAKIEIDKEVQDKLRSILTEIESLVDPFDYEMMNESLHQNLIQNVAKTSSLYVLLSSNPNKRNMSTVQRIDTGTNQHNLIDLVGTTGNKHSKSCIRFGMLPISGYMVPSKNSIHNSSMVAPPPIVPLAVVAEPEPNSDKCDNKPNVNSTNVLSSRSRNRNYYLGRLGSHWF